MRLQIFLFLLPGILLTGCVSSKRFEQYQNQQKNQIQIMQDEHSAEMQELRDEVAAANLRTEKLEEKWGVFARNYTPDLHEQIAENLRIIKEAREQIETIHKEVQSDRDEIESMRKQSGKQLAIVQKNAETSEVTNVVNRFDQLLSEYGELRKQWDRSLQQLEGDADDAQRAAIDAAKFTKDARQLSYEAKTTLDQYHRYERDLYNLKYKLKNTNHDIYRLEGRYKSLYNDYCYLKRKIHHH